MDTYKPINCNLYDYLEEAVTLKKKNVILLKSDSGPQIINGQVVDLFSKDKVEYLKMKKGLIIRLDTIQHFNDIDFSKDPTCKE